MEAIFLLASSIWPIASTACCTTTTPPVASFFPEATSLPATLACSALSSIVAAICSIEAEVSCKDADC